MLTAMAFTGIFVVFLGLASSVVVIYAADGCGRGVHERLSSSMRWIIRDLGIFLYGCVFAGKYIFLGRSVRQ